MAGDEMDGIGLSRPADGQYGIGLMDLRTLMEKRKKEGYDAIQEKYGGVVEMCKKLYTSPNEG